MASSCQHFLKSRNNTARAHGDTTSLPFGQRTSAWEWEAPKLSHLKVKALLALLYKQAKQRRENAALQSHIHRHRGSSQGFSFPKWNRLHVLLTECPSLKSMGVVKNTLLALQHWLFFTRRQLLYVVVRMWWGVRV